MLLDACVESCTQVCNELGPWGPIAALAFQLAGFAVVYWKTHRSVARVDSKVAAVDKKVEALSTPPPSMVVGHLSIPPGAPQPAPAVPKDLLQSVGGADSTDTES